MNEPQLTYVFPSFWREQKSMRLLFIINVKPFNNFHASSVTIQYAFYLHHHHNHHHHHHHYHNQPKISRSGNYLAAKTETAVSSASGKQTKAERLKTKM